MAPSGECLRGYKPCVVDCSRLAPSCGTGLRAGTYCAVLRGSLLIVCKSKASAFVICVIKNYLLT